MRHFLQEGVSVHANIHAHFGADDGSVACSARVPGAMAQDEGTPERTFDDLTQLEGLESAVERDWIVDYEDFFSSMASPDANTDFEDIEYPEGIQYLTAIVMRFDGDDNSQAAFNTAQEEISAQPIEGAELEEIEVDGFGDNTLALGATQEDEATGSTSTVVILTQEDEYLYMSIGVSTNEDINDRVSDIVKHMIDADAGDGEGEFNADGTSEGGLWDKLPAADDELVGEDLVVSDIQIFPEAEEEAA